MAWTVLSRMWKEEDDDGTRMLIGALDGQRVKLLANPDLTSANSDDASLPDYLLFGWVPDTEAQ